MFSINNTSENRRTIRTFLQNVLAFYENETMIINSVMTQYDQSRIAYTLHRTMARTRSRHGGKKNRVRSAAGQR